MRGDLPRYFLLAYAITWLGLSPLVAAHLGWIGPVPASLHALGALGPIAAALIVAGRTNTRGQLVRSAFVERPPRPWLLVALGSPVALLLVAMLGVAVFGSGRFDWVLLADEVARPGWWANLFVASVLYGFGEEPGWRGFALPRLQHRFPAWGATLVLGVLWAAWHTPMFVYRFDFDGVGTVVGFFISLLAGAFWLTVLYNSSGGSVLAVALWHTLWNVVNLVAAALGSPVVAVLNALMMVLGFGVLFAGPKELTLGGRRVQIAPSTPS